ncbi:DeoR/GlpR family DNA-binding transcription regulator [Oribacterium parvum]|jgi:transcriptional regulator, deoR family|uniref:DeoR/GlpR family DNA-binding transcription regulator n=1 Tax=Oribacterium parvum TaxID=1501329 RepID=UPI0028E3E8E8|nr:DeoR/GlpR family DNA-binding transcription regulator [Oribacterium parvum]
MEEINICIPAQRQQQILEYLQSQKSITIRKAAEIFMVSEATVRRDLDELASTGKIERTHGGAVLHTGTGFEWQHAEKMQEMIPEKKRIAIAAKKLIEDGDSLFLDTGTTTYLLAEELKEKKRLTVVTNNLDIAYTTELDATSTMIITGGIRRDGYSSLVGDIAADLVRKLYVDVSFIGADAVSVGNGVFNTNFNEIGIKKSGIESGKRKVLLADSSKFSRKALAKICDLQEFDIIITDSGIDEAQLKILKEKIARVIIV